MRRRLFRAKNLDFFIYFHKLCFNLTCGLKCGEYYFRIKTIVISFLSGTMIKMKMKISEMRLILFLIAFSSCTFSTGRKTKKDILETYSVLKTF